MMLGASVNVKGHIHWTKVAKEHLEKSWEKGGTNLQNVARRASAMFAKIWMQLADALQHPENAKPFWMHVIWDEVCAWLDHLQIPRKQLPFLTVFSNKKEAPFWRRALHHYSLINRYLMPISSLDDFLMMPINFNKLFLD